MNRRLLSFIALLFGVMILPNYIYLPALLAAIIIFPVFWEGLVVGFIVDILYGGGIYYSFFSLLSLIIMIPIRNRIRT